MSWPKLESSRSEPWPMGHVSPFWLGRVPHLPTPSPNPGRGAKHRPPPPAGMRWCEASHRRRSRRPGQNPMAVDRSARAGYNMRCRRGPPGDGCLLQRGVAQPGSAPEWGSGGRWFKSSRPDQAVVSRASAACMGRARMRRAAASNRAAPCAASGCVVRPSVLQSLRYAPPRLACCSPLQCLDACAIMACSFTHYRALLRLRQNTTRGRP